MPIDELSLLNWEEETLRESIASERDRELSAFDAARRQGALDLARVGLRRKVEADEAFARSSVFKEERTASNQLDVAAQLLCHGAPVHWTPTGALPLPCEEAVNQVDAAIADVPATTTFDGPVLRRIPSGEVRRKVEDIRESALRDMQFGGATAVLAARVQRLCSLEGNSRTVILKDELLEWRRSTRGLRLHTEGTRQAVREFNRERLRLYAATHTEEEFVGFVTHSLQDEEARLRKRHVLHQQHAFGLLSMFASAAPRIVRLRDECRDVGSEKEAIRKQGSVARVRATAEHALRAARFNAWLAGAKVAARRRHVGSVTLHRAGTARSTLLGRYAHKWNSVLYRSQQRSCTAFLLAEHERSAQLWHVLSFEGASRMFIETTLQASAWAELVDQHFCERDEIRRGKYAAAIATLANRNCHRHRLSRFVKWFEWWRRSTLVSRALWLRAQMDNALTAGLFAAWQRSVQSRVLRLRCSRQIITERSQVQDRLEVEEAACRGAIAISLEWHHEIAALQEKREHLRRALQSSFAHLLARRTDAQTLLGCFKRWAYWTSWRRSLIITMALIRTNTLRLMSSVFNKWAMFHEQSTRSRRELLRLVTAATATYEAEFIVAVEESARGSVDMCETRARRRLDRARRSAWDDPFRQAVLETLHMVAGSPWFKRWRSYVLLRQRRRRLRALALEMEQRSSQLHLQTRFGNWRWPFAPQQIPSVETARVQFKSRLHCGLGEHAARQNLAAHAAHGLSAIRMSLEVAIGIDCGANRHAAVSGLEVQAMLSHAHLTMRRWRGAMQAASQRASAVQRIPQLSRNSETCHMAWRFETWKRFTSKRRLPTNVDALAARNNLVVLKRFYRLLQPASVRLARVSLAKRRLLAARRAASQPLAADGSDTGRRTTRATLPALQYRGRPRPDR